GLPSRPRSKHKRRRGWPCSPPQAVQGRRQRMTGRGPGYPGRPARRGAARYRGAMTTADWMRRGATAIAAARTAIGVLALAAPTLVARPWVGPDRGTVPRVLGRALGGRDLVL